VTRTRAANQTSQWSATGTPTTYTEKLAPVGCLNFLPWSSAPWKPRPTYQESTIPNGETQAMLCVRTGVILGELVTTNIQNFTLQIGNGWPTKWRCWSRLPKKLGDQQLTVMHESQQPVDAVRLPIGGLVQARLNY